MPVTWTTLVTTVSNDFVRRLPGAHAPCGTNSNIRTRDRRLGVVWILIEPVEEKHFYWHNPSHSAWPWWWRANSFDKAESLSQRCECVGCHLNSDQAHRFLCLKGNVRVRDSMLWRLQLTRNEWNLYGLKYFFFWGSAATQQSPKSPWNAFSNARLMSSSQISRLAPKKKLRVFWNCTLRDLN